MKARHAVCLECGAVLHVPVSFASSRSALRLESQAWTTRLAMGCRECGGRLSTLRLDACEECELFVTRWVH